MDIAHRRYVTRTIAFMVPYALLNIAAITGAFDDLAGPARWVFALAVAAPIAGQVWATLMLISDGDEFVRAITAKRFIIASGLAMTLLSAWGFGESYADAAHIPGWMIYPLFWLCFGVTAPFIRTSR